MKKDLQTVKRRFDWVTASGMVLFGVIVILEIIVAVSVPLLVRQEGLFAEDILKAQLKADFDMMREHIFYVSNQASDDDIKSEISLLSANANNLADYLREQADMLETPELLELIDRVKRMDAIVEQGFQGKSMTGKIQLDTSKFITGLAKPSME